MNQLLNAAVAGACLWNSGGLVAAAAGGGRRRLVGFVVPCHLVDLHPAVEAAVTAAGHTLERGTTLLSVSDELPAPVHGIAPHAGSMVAAALAVPHAAASELQDWLAPPQDHKPLHHGVTSLSLFCLFAPS